MRPIFEYDHARGALLVRMEADTLSDGSRLFMVKSTEPTVRADYVRVAVGAEPPLYVPPIRDARLFDMVCQTIQPDP